MKNTIHIGKIICDRLIKDGRTKRWLAEKTCYEYSYFCKILKRPHIDTGLLFRISSLLQYDFFAVLSTQLKQKVADCNHKVVL